MITRLCSLLQEYAEPEHIDIARRAYEHGANSHEGQYRRSGEPYITHPLSVAIILAEMRLDYQSVVAAILHDVIEDTAVTKDELAAEFGTEVAGLVDGVSKLTQIKFENRVEAHAENFRKMILAMTRDIRVILIKLADRLHNMRTLGAMPADKRRRIARETLDIYAPIANRLGMNVLRTELQTLGFQSLYPMRHRVLEKAVKKVRGNRREIVEKIESALKLRLEEEGLASVVVGREKNLYSIYNKMRSKRLPFADVFDVYGFRIIVDKPDTCYRVLGAVHHRYKPVPGRFKDYVAIPKANGYQSLHTVLFGPYGVHIEVQIRAEDMDKVAEAGVAAHWLYKSGDNSDTQAQKYVRDWLHNLLEFQKKAGNSLEFIENVKIDLFPDEVYVFTPKGEIMELPRGATAVDFAYAVHTDVGNTCIAAKIDRRLAPLRTPLVNGQTVEVVATQGGQPNPAWLNFVVTGKARSNIRHFLKNLESKEAIALGRRLLNKSLSEYLLTVSDLPRDRVSNLLKEFSYETLDELLMDIGLGNRMATLVARRLVPEHKMKRSGNDSWVARQPQAIKDVLTRYVPAWLKHDRYAVKPLVIRGTEGMVVSFAKCCRPIPGDPILAVVTAGRGIVVHTEPCKNVGEFRKRPETWLDVEWESKVEGDFLVDIRVDVLNQRGVLATVASAIAAMNGNIANVNISDRDGKYSSLDFVISVRGRKHLANIMRFVRKIDKVVRISRSKG
ncbi:MAG: bifunctional GTP diphosphokinase/guanosine-3',5'-bis pyrophosphate 3'-pyrophosphohydrolase [Gammaproteobacteria bacterium]|nr:bifunctional GTP diphosphokinase/guanosine-3',5'-bis pyrophosphate 3'-pyrophosphohydrolase [Gammaproteobacteria bacterium]